MKHNPTPATRDKIYTFVAAVLAILVVLGFIRADEFDAEQITETVMGLITFASLVLAKVNVTK